MADLIMTIEALAMALRRMADAAIEAVDVARTSMSGPVIGMSLGEVSSYAHGVSSRRGFSVVRSHYFRKCPPERATLRSPTRLELMHAMAVHGPRLVLVCGFADGDGYVAFVGEAAHG